MPHNKTLANIEKTIANVLKRGITGADIARNPGKNTPFATAIQKEANFQAGQIARGQKIVFQNVKFEGTNLVEDFARATAELKQEFIRLELENQFGPQNITSTTDPAGIPAAPTAAQIKAIEDSFRTPLDLALSHEVPLTGPTQPSKPPSTLISGQGASRRRGRGGPQEPTILTSDSRRGIGGSTILG